MYGSKCANTRYIKNSPIKRFVGVCVVLLDLGFVAFIFCRVLRELKNIVVVARWLCTGGDSMQYSASSEGI